MDCTQAMPNTLFFYVSFGISDVSIPYRGGRKTVQKGQMENHCTQWNLAFGLRHALLQQWILLFG